MSGDRIVLSVLVCSIDTRTTTFLPRIQAQLFGQWSALPPEDQRRVEILVLTDNRQMVLGRKRNVLLGMASGEYVQFVDDDDRVSDDFLAALLAGTKSSADCIVFHADVTLNGGPPKRCYYSRTHGHDRNTPDAYYRLPNHIACVRRDLAARAGFPELNFGEDAAYAKRLLPLLTTEHRIDRVLYYYDYDSATTATRGTQRPVVDVVVLSKADTAVQRRMTQHTIDTCRAGAGGLLVNVLVVESGTTTTYDGAKVVQPPDGPFNYNRYANHAIRLGSAEWLMVANNDLTFRPGWLRHLLAAGCDVVSPRSTADKRQRDLTSNTAGTTCGRHFSGWCYMLRRTLWQDIGGLDDCVDFWCSDDVVIEQVTAAGVTPMLVADAVVEHAVSATLRTLPRADYDRLTWRNVHIYNQRYGRAKFAADPRYLAWMAANATEVPA